MKTLEIFQTFSTHMARIVGLFFNELVNDCITNFFLAESSFVMRCLRTLKENSAQKGQIMDRFSPLRSFLRSCYLYHACSR